MSHAGLRTGGDDDEVVDVLLHLEDHKDKRACGSGETVNELLRQWQRRDEQAARVLEPMM